MNFIRRYVVALVMCGIALFAVVLIIALAAGVYFIKDSTYAKVDHPSQAVAIPIGKTVTLQRLENGITLTATNDADILQSAGSYRILIQSTYVDDQLYTWCEHSGERDGQHYCMARLDDSIFANGDKFGNTEFRFYVKDGVVYLVWNQVIWKLAKGGS